MRERLAAREKTVASANFSPRSHHRRWPHAAISARIFGEIAASIGWHQTCLSPSSKEESGKVRWKPTQRA